MGKVFITDEVNDNYTANVTNAGKVQVEGGAASHAAITSAHTVTSAVRISSSPCYLKSVIIGQYPATAAALWLFDGASAGLEGYSAYGTSGDNIVGKVAFDIGAASASVCGMANYGPIVVPFDVYCTSGLIAAVSPSANDSGQYIGCMKGVTITYQG